LNFCLLASATASLGLALCCGCGPASTLAKEEIEARIREKEQFRTVTLKADAPAGEAVDPDGTVYDLSYTVQDRIISYTAESREADASWEKLEKVPQKHLGLQEAVFTKKEDGHFERTGVSKEGLRCEFILNRQAESPAKGGVAYDFRVRLPDKTEQSGVIVLNLSPKVRSGSIAR
jgi:hypothetical protein